jgi:biopolymer transport protein ExbB
MLTDKIFAFAQVGDQAVLWLLIILSVISIALILERFFALRKVASDSNRIRARLKMALASQSIEDVEELSKDITTMEGRAVNYGLKHIRESGSKGLEHVFNSMLLMEKPELEKYLNFMATIGSNAPYIGLLGTVLGIMKAFNDLAQSSDAGQQTVMAGISLALVSTAAGLFVAIPAVMAYNYFLKQTKSVLQNLDVVKELCIALAKKRGL